MFNALKTLTILALATSASASGVVRVLGDVESICGKDQSKPSIAYKDSDTAKYNAGLATARVKVDHFYHELCTGWLWGSEGHLITEHVCIRDAAEASTAAAEFGAECATVERPPQQKVERQPWHDPYGYLQARDTNVQLDDPVYIASYPQNYPRHISHLHDDGKFARITNTSVYYCQVDSVAYNLDTQILTTGSPILDQRDNKVIAINNCGGGCTRGFDGNSGVKMTKIIAFLRAKNLLPKDAVAGGLC